MSEICDLSRLETLGRGAATEFKLLSFNGQLAMDAAQLGKLVGVCKATIMRAAHRGEIDSFLVGSSRRFSVATAHAMLEKQQPQPLAHYQTKKSRKPLQK